MLGPPSGPEPLRRSVQSGRLGNTLEALLLPADARDATEQRIQLSWFEERSFRYGGDSSTEPTLGIE